MGRGITSRKNISWQGEQGVAGKHEVRKGCKDWQGEERLAGRIYAIRKVVGGSTEGVGEPKVGRGKSYYQIRTKVRQRIRQVTKGKGNRNNRGQRNDTSKSQAREQDHRRKRRSMGEKKYMITVERNAARMEEQTYLGQTISANAAHAEGIGRRSGMGWSALGKGGRSFMNIHLPLSLDACIISARCQSRKVVAFPESSGEKKKRKIRNDKKKV